MLNPVTMTSEEIVRHYQQAKDRDGDIQILADLNMTSREEICNILKAAGIELCLRGPKTKSTFAAQIAPLYAQGLSDQTIAERVGCTTTTVRNWRKRNGFTERHLPEAAKPGEPVAAAKTAKADVTAYERVETILGAIPGGADDAVLRQAGRLCLSLLADYIAKRLGLAEPLEAADKLITDT